MNVVDDCTDLLADCDTTTRFLKLSIFDTESNGGDVSLDGHLLTNIYPTGGFSNWETYQEAYVIFDEYSEVQKLSRLAKNFRGFRNPRF